MIVTYKNPEQLIKDFKDDGDIDKENLKLVNEDYKILADNMRKDFGIDVLFLDTSDHNINSQIEKIINFINPKKFKAFVASGWFSPEQKRTKKVLTDL